MGALRRAAHGLAVLVAFVLTLVLVPLVVVALLAGAAQELTGPSLYKEALASQRLYERLPALVGAQATAQLSYVPKDAEPDADAGAPPAFRSLSPGVWEAIVREVVPPDWLRAQTERALDLLLADPAPTGPVVISIADLKVHVVSGAGLRAYLDLVRAQPACAATELASWRAGPTALPTCRPPEEVISAATPLIQADLARAVGDLPDEVDLRGALGPPSPEDQGDGGLDLARLRAVMRVAILAPLVPALLVVLLVVRSGRSLLRWLGVPLLIGASGALALAVAGVPWIDGQVTRELARAPAYWSPALLSAAKGLALEVVGVVSGRLTLVAAAAAVAGITMLVLGYRAVRVALPPAPIGELATARR